MKKNISNLKRIEKFSQFKASVKTFHEEKVEFFENLLYDDVVDAIWSWCFSFGEMVDDKSSRELGGDVSRTITVGRMGEDFLQNILSCFEVVA
ncbi:hypothetical protein AVEN_111726-1 [Araneus ventricosus]|uniref:Uncharacterized protein n=1 Tax=Araneus ventricosus TaxID=182803 RepID=A0A4Y2CAY4_ARAVE|nr:hypothetical protein AVEN_111726-1 [Araneus ventricosus]